MIRVLLICVALSSVVLVWVGLSNRKSGHLIENIGAASALQVQRGRDLITKTAVLIGPSALNPSRRFSGNNLACSSCHLDAGTTPFGLDFFGVSASFPQYRPRSGKVVSLAERVEGCMQRSMNGKRFPANDPDLLAMLAYIKSVQSTNDEAQANHHGVPPIAKLSRAADPDAGRHVYSEFCAACHGVSGQGLGKVSLSPDHMMAVPPLWGSMSFNDGAGMDRLSMAASFIRANMPRGTKWNEPILTAEQAWDVAAFIIAQDRPHMTGLERDFPNRAEKPFDVGYGPFNDNLPPAIHRFGPFNSVREADRTQSGVRSKDLPSVGSGMPGNPQ